MTQHDTPRILVVDDLQDNLDLIREVFEDEPYEIVTAHDAETALETAGNDPPDVAVLDVHMPDVDGFELCRQLRELPHTKRIPILFLTANRTSTDDAVEGLDLGGCDYITKPFEAEELRARIRVVLRTQCEHGQDIAVTKKVARRLLGR